MCNITDLPTNSGIGKRNIKPSSLGKWRVSLQKLQATLNKTPLWVCWLFSLVNILPHQQSKH